MTVDPITTTFATVLLCFLGWHLSPVVCDAVAWMLGWEIEEAQR